MKIAITGGTGFVGGHLARILVEKGHQVILISRGKDRRDGSIFQLKNTHIANVGTNDSKKLEEAFTGCDAVAHCAGINREIGQQTYKKVHVEGTQNVVDAAKRARVKKVAILSFLRARPDCGSGYHESKWAAEEIVRNSGLDYTVFKAGVIYGKGDHMLDHLSHAFHTFPIFAMVGMNDQLICPTAVEDLINVVAASLVEGRLSRQTVSVMGPEELTLSAAVKRVASVVGKHPFYLRLPLAFHYTLSWVVERIMTIPLISSAQTRILSEGITEALPYADLLPEDLKPKQKFTEDQIRRGLPEPKSFGLNDLRYFSRT